jgi:hypothetical protein
MADKTAKRAPPRAPRYRAKDLLSINDNGFLLDATDGESYTLNRTGLAIVRALIAGADSRRLHRDLAKEHLVSEERARRDVDRFLAHLAELGLVVRETRD